MSITEAERKRLARQRQKENARSKIKDVVKPAAYLKRPFSEFIGDETFQLDENLDAFGIQITGRDFLATEVQEFDSQYERDEPLTALERAIGLVGAFIDAAAELSHKVNVYKLDEIEKAIEAALLAASRLPTDDVASLKDAFAEISRLKAIQSDLRKPTRHTFLTVRATGE